MEFKRPADRNNLFDSPANRKKLKTSSLSTTIASPEIRKEKNDNFDDNFSQFFQSQFIRQIEADEESFVQRKSGLSNNELVDTSISAAKLGNYSFTQCSGLSQIVSQNAFDISIPLGQRQIENETSGHDDEHENCNQQLLSQCLSAFPNEMPAIDNGIWEEEFSEGEPPVQSSQMFLQEVSALHLNITSLIDETLCVNRSISIDGDNPLHDNDDQFDLYRSTVTQSEYMQLKRAESFENSQSEVKQPSPNKELNTEAFEDELLAEFADNEMHDQSNRLNECIDPNSSAIASMLDDNDDDFFNDTFVTQVHEVGKQTETGIIEQTKSIVPNNKPVTAANFCSMGSFFGLPPKVKTLIKEFKQIEDLYGKTNQHFS